MKKIITFCLFGLFATLSAFSTNYNSTGAGASFWNVAASWISVPGGVNAVPTATDNCTILNTHTVKVNAAGQCANLTINGTGKIQYVAAVTIQVNGNYTLSGTEQGNGTLQFNSAGSTITVTGTVAATLKYFFNANINISASSVISKLASTTQLAAGATVTNLGNYTMGGTLNASSSTWTNGAGATLSLSQNGFMSGGTFDASAIGNQVTLTYVTGNVPSTSSGYYKLIIGAASGTKSLSQNTTVASDFTINAGNTLDANNFNLFVGGNWLKNGSFIASSGSKVEFNGGSAQTISGVATTTFTQLTINNSSGGVSISSGTYILDEVLTISNGNFNTGGNSFTMTSTASKTARIAPVSVTGSISGDFTIERFISTRDTTWADISSPVQSTTFLDWDNELPAISYAYSPPTALPSAWTYNETADNYVPVTSSGTSLTPGKGFEVYLSGDFLYNNLPNTTMNTIGVPNFGDANLSSLISFNNAGSNLVGNPFASNILWNNVFAASSNIDVNYDIFDYTTGGYNTFGLGSEIGSSQGFWVYTTGAAPTLIIPEGAKTTTSNSDLKSTIVQPYFTFKLSSTDKNNSYSHLLKIGATADATDGFDFGKDHLFRKSPLPTAPGIYTIIDNKKSAINVFSSSDDTYDMPVATSVGISGNYKIETNGFDFIGDYTCIRLEDKLLNKIIDLTSDLSYSFYQKSTDNPERFVAHFSKTGNCKSLISAPGVNNSHIEMEPEVLPSSNGNIINFYNSESTNTTVSVTDLLGRKIINDLNLDALNQSVSINLPESYSGLYFIKIESSKYAVTKKFVKK